MSAICVVGGGLSGLEFALHAALQGKKIHIIEAGPQLRQAHVNDNPEVFDGDAKVRHWISSNHWGEGGGISERLGGRSLCYHGVMLPLEETAMNDWPVEWQQRLNGPDGLYKRLYHDWQPKFPEMKLQGEAHPTLEHVPQAAKLFEDGRFTAYSPMYMLDSLIRDGSITIQRGLVERVENTDEGVVVYGKNDERLNELPFSKCVLSASAIVNTKIIASSLAKSFTVPITDHYCIGLFVKVKNANEIGQFRHQMIWHGYNEQQDIHANFFVLERPNSSDGDRIIEIMAVAEQNPERSSLSELKCDYRDGESHLEITAQHSSYDNDNNEQISERLINYAESLLGIEITPAEINKPSFENTDFLKSAGNDGRWSEYNTALESLCENKESNVYRHFSLPYGAFEHESCCHPIEGDGPSALTTNLELKQIPNVYALGPGAFPRLGIANPAITICALSRWLAEHI